MIKFNSNNLKTMSKYLADCLASENIEVAINLVHIGEITSFEIAESEDTEDYFELIAYNGIHSSAVVYFHAQDTLSVHCIHSKNANYIGLLTINIELHSN